MSRVEILEREIRALSLKEFAELRQWLTEFDAQAWDRQFEMDVNSGKLDAFAEKALRAHAFQIGDPTPAHRIQSTTAEVRQIP